MAVSINGDGIVSGITTFTTPFTFVGVTTFGSINAGVVTASTINVGSAVTIHSGGFRVGSSDLHSSGLTVQNVNSTGVVTATTFSGNLTGNVTGNVTGDATGLSGTPNLNVGVVTATSFFGNGSGLTGAGSTVSDDTSTNQTFYPLFTQTTSGTITSSKVSTSKLTFNPSTGTLTVVDINSTSDINLKTNINTVENALDTVSQLRGVSFDWKETEKSSYGVIAQEIEEVLPELVGSEEVKTVNYNGIIGVLIEAIKELKNEIEELKKDK
jgi:hypothetical protein